MTKLKKGLVLLLLLTIVCSLFALVACENIIPPTSSDEQPNNEQKQPSNEQEKPSDKQPTIVELKPANQNYKGEDVDYSLYFNTDGNGKITDLSDYAIQNRDSIIQLEIPKKIGDEEITELSLNFDALPYLRSLTIPENIVNIDEPLKVKENNPFLLIYCETIDKPIGWCDNWKPKTIDDLSIYPPVVWDYKNNVIADDGKIYGFASNGMLYALKDNEAELVFSGIEDIENLELTSSFKFNEKTYSLRGMHACSFFGLQDDDLPLQNNKKLKSVKIPNGVTSINPFVFGGSSFTRIEIPDSVTRIGECAFYFCPSLISIEIPSSVTSIGEYAFIGCYSVKSISVAEDNINYKSDGNCLIEKQTNSIIFGCKNSVIPNYVTNIDENAFGDCVGLESIKIPSSIKNIGVSAFSGCSSLISITFGEHSQLTSIGNYAFHRCSSLESIEIPSSVTSMGSDAFSNCSDLTSITFGENSQLASIGRGAFNGCSSLIGVYITDITSWCKIEFSDFDANPLCNAHNLYLNNELVTELVIPSNVTSIGMYAFSGCNSLTSVTFEIETGWYWNDDISETIISVDVTNPSENVKYLAMMGFPFKRKVD